MAEQDIGHIASATEHGARSSLLMPVVKGHTLESDDVSIFLGVRLSSGDEEIEPNAESRFS